MVEQDEKHSLAAAPMQDILQAEVAAREAVESAHVTAAGLVASAHKQAGAVDAAARERIRKINASTEQACAVIRRQAEQERDELLQRLNAAGQVKPDAKTLENAVRKFARDLINGKQIDMRIDPHDK